MCRAVRAVSIDSATIDAAGIDGAGSGIAEPGWSVSACIEWLVRSNLFIVKLDGSDDRHEWYRYHHLFRDMLRQRADVRTGRSAAAPPTPTGRAVVCARYLFDEALRHALAAGDLDLAVQVVEEGLPDALNREDWLTLERWLRMMPASLSSLAPGS